MIYTFIYFMVAILKPYQDIGCIIGLSDKQATGQLSRAMLLLYHRGWSLGE